MSSGPAPGFHFRKDPKTRERYVEVPILGELLADSPVWNKGTAFTGGERDALHLRGILPPNVETIKEQMERALHNYRYKPTDLERYIFLIALLDQNETLFYRLLLDHLEEFLPIVYTPTVGLACQKFGHIFRRPRGLYLTPDDTDRVDDVLGNWPFTNVSVVVATDGERILGLGDLGAGGMGIPIGKASLYVAGAGIHPAETLPVCLDVGTNNEELLADPLYTGLRMNRIRGEKYDRLVEAFIHGVEKRWPGAIIQFEDFAKQNAHRLLDHWRTRSRCFNDDIQGTATVTLAGILAALRMTKGKLEDQRVVIAGAGSAGIGIARMLRGADIRILNSRGLLTTKTERLTDVQKEFIRDEAPADLAETVRRAKPHILIGTSGQPGIFTREILQAMDPERPIVFPLSNPTSRIECTPEQAREWTNGRAIVATGSPFPDTPQCNNMYIFPGVGLGVLASGAPRITDDMFFAAAQALADLGPDEQIFPPLRDIREVSRTVAMAVAKAGGAGDEVPGKIDELMWEPEYLPYRPGPDCQSRVTVIRMRESES